MQLGLIRKSPSKRTLLILGALVSLFGLCANTIIVLYADKKIAYFESATGAATASLEEARLYFTQASQKAADSETWSQALRTHLFMSENELPFSERSITFAQRDSLNYFYFAGTGSYAPRDVEENHNKLSHALYDRDVKLMRLIRETGKNQNELADEFSLEEHADLKKYASFRDGYIRAFWDRSRQIENANASQKEAIRNLRNGKAFWSMILVGTQFLGILIALSKDLFPTTPQTMFRSNRNCCTGVERSNFPK